MRTSTARWSKARRACSSRCPSVDRSRVASVRPVERRCVDRALIGPVGGLPLILGGVLGAMIMIATFDWAVILLSSLTGAMLLMQVLGPDGGNSFLVFAGLAIVGVLIQAALWKRVGS